MPRGRADVTGERVVVAAGAGRFAPSRGAPPTSTPLTRRCTSCDRAYRAALLDLIDTGSATVAHQAVVDARRHWELLPETVELRQFRADVITMAARRLP